MIRRCLGRTSCTMLSAFLVVSAAVAQSPPATKEVPKAKEETGNLVGTWEGYAVEGKGEKPDRGPIHIRITITDTKISAINLGDANKDMGSGTYRIDPSKTVKEIDAEGVVLPGSKSRNYSGIYELDGDTLRWCVNNRQQTRPTEFRTAAGNYLLVLKRKK